MKKTTFKQVNICAEELLIKLCAALLLQGSNFYVLWNKLAPVCDLASVSAEVSAFHFATLCWLWKKWEKISRSSSSPA